MNALCQNILPEEIIQLDKTNNTRRSEAFNLQSFKTLSHCLSVSITAGTSVDTITELLPLFLIFAIL